MADWTLAPKLAAESRERDALNRLFALSDGVLSIELMSRDAALNDVIAVLDRYGEQMGEGKTASDALAAALDSLQAERKTNG